MSLFSNFFNNSDSAGSTVEKMQEVTKNYLANLGLTSTNKGSVDVDPVKMSYDVDAFSSDTIGANSTNEIYDATGDFYEPIQGDVVLDDFESYADDSAIRAAWVTNDVTNFQNYKTTAYIGNGIAVTLGTSPASIGAQLVKTVVEDFSGINNIKLWALTSSTVSIIIKIVDTVGGTHTSGVNQVITSWGQIVFDLSGISDANKSNITSIIIECGTHNTGSTVTFDEMTKELAVPKNMILIGNSNVPANQQTINNGMLAFHVAQPDVLTDIDDFEGYADTTALKAVWVPEDDAKVTITKFTNISHDGGASMKMQQTSAPQNIGVEKTFTAEDWSGYISLNMWVQSQNIGASDFSVKIFSNGVWHTVGSEDWSDGESSDTWYFKQYSLIGIADVDKNSVTKIRIEADTTYTGLGNFFDEISVTVPDNSLVPNTDIKGYTTVDGGSVWNELTLTDEGNIEGLYNRLVGSVEDISTAGKDIRWKIQTFNNKNIEVHDASLWWEESRIISPELHGLYLPNQKNPDSRITDVFFEDFEKFTDFNSIVASAENGKTLFDEKFFMVAGSGTLRGGSGGGNAAVSIKNGSNCIMFDINGVTAWHLTPRWTVDYHNCNQISIESNFLMRDITNNAFQMGFVVTNLNTPNGFGNVGYGMRKNQNNNYSFLEGYINQTGAISTHTLIADTYHTYKMVMNLTGGVIDNIQLYFDGTLMDTLSTVTEYVNETLRPYLRMEGSTNGDDMMLDYIKVWASK